ncbi:ABC-2 type transporter permease [Candidatus Hepatincolaceae symbiont of Richtersius coronifer]
MEKEIILNDRVSQKNNYWISLYSFYSKEVKRFLKVWGQTVFSPLVTTSLYLLVFVISVGPYHSSAQHTYVQFLAPGLIMMAVIQNAFSNTSSSIIISKISGNLIDLMMAPLSTNQIILGYLLGAITRGVLIAIIIMLYIMIFSPLKFHNIFLMLYFVISASALLGLLGIIGGILCAKFDQIANFTTLVVTPFSFLSGTFYSINKLPSMVQNFSHYNPFFYMIDGFRYSFIGVSDGNIKIGILVLLACNIICYSVAFTMWHTGYKVKN